MLKRDLTWRATSVKKARTMNEGKQNIHHRKPRRLYLMGGENFDRASCKFSTILNVSLS